MSRIRYHSDCDYFAGCENMLANFFGDVRLAKENELSFSYRRSAKYEEGLRERVPTPPRTLPLPVVDFHQVSGLLNSWPAPFPILYKALTRLLLVKYWLFAWNVWVLRRSFGEERIDVLQINNGGFPGAASCLAAGLAARWQGARTVIHVVNNMPVPYAGLDRRLDYPLDRLAVGAASVFVTGSEHARRSLLETLKLPAERVVSIPNGIADRPLTETPAQVRARLKIPEGRPLIAVVAVLETRKGHRVLLQALAKLKKEGLSPMPVTALGGDGPLRGELEALCRELGLSEDVLFLGWEPRHFDLFNAADVVALPSTGFEDFPNVTIEAMGLGKTVVATRVGGVGEQIQDGETGLLAQPGDVDGLAAALGRACRDGALRQRLGKSAKERFQREYTAAASVDRYRALYRSLQA